MEIIKTLHLKKSPILIEEYKRIHTKVWPEIIEGIKSVGIDRMDIYINGNTLFMIIGSQDEIDWGKAFSLLAELPRQKEWEEFVSKYQECEESSTSGEKWKDAERIFTLPDFC